MAFMMFSLAIIGVTPLITHASAKEESLKVQKTITTLEQQKQDLLNQQLSRQEEQMNLKNKLKYNELNKEETLLLIAEEMNELESSGSTISTLTKGIISQERLIKNLLRRINILQSQNRFLVYLSQRRLLDDSKTSYVGVLNNLHSNITQYKNLLATLSQIQDTHELSQLNLDRLEEIYQFRMTELQQVIEADTKEMQSRGEQLKQLDQTISKQKEQYAQLQIEIEADLVMAENRNVSYKAPQPGELFAWPLKEILVTQMFGQTQDAKRLYVSGSHSGVDFRANYDTILSIGKGVVAAVGDTDLACSRSSFGKWILVEYPEGVSVTYAHLSKVFVSPGDVVGVGDAIAVSGNTGRTTGPHLHLGMYTTYDNLGKKVVHVEGKESTVCKGKILVQPRAPRSAYLDPLDYLPKLQKGMAKSGTTHNH